MQVAQKTYLLIDVHDEGLILGATFRKGERHRKTDALIGTRIQATGRSSSFIGLSEPFFTFFESFRHLTELGFRLRNLGQLPRCNIQPKNLSCAVGKE